MFPYIQLNEGIIITILVIAGGNLGKSSTLYISFVDYAHGVLNMPYHIGQHTNTIDFESIDLFTSLIISNGSEDGRLIVKCGIKERSLNLFVFTQHAVHHFPDSINIGLFSPIYLQTTKAPSPQGSMYRITSRLGFHKAHELGDVC